MCQISPLSVTEGFDCESSVCSALLKGISGAVMFIINSLSPPTLLLSAPEFEPTVSKQNLQLSLRYMKESQNAPGLSSKNITHMQNSYDVDLYQFVSHFASRLIFWNTAALCKLCSLQR